MPPPKFQTHRYEFQSLLRTSMSQELIIWLVWQLRQSVSIMWQRTVVVRLVLPECKAQNSLERSTDFGMFWAKRAHCYGCWDGLLWPQALARCPHNMKPYLSDYRIESTQTCPGNALVGPDHTGTIAMHFCWLPVTLTVFNMSHEAETSCLPITNQQAQVLSQYH